MSQSSEKLILDACCGGRMGWWAKENPIALFCDNREESMPITEAGKKRIFHVSPDLLADFRNMPHEDEMFHLVLFDPPHMEKLNTASYMKAKYGQLLPTWEDDICAGFSECFRVLKDNGTLIFKWSEVQIPLSRILPLSPYNPLFGHRSGKNMRTHWIAFMKHYSQKKGATA